MSTRGRRIVRATLLLAILTASGCSLPRWPVEAPMTSGFGLRWLGGWPDLHRGVDFSVPVGTPVHAMFAGRVRFVLPPLSIPE